MIKTLKALLLASGLVFLAAAPQANAAEASAPAPLSATDFLAKNAQQPGVITLSSGLQYKVLHAGEAKGPTPKAGDVIKVNYEGALASGQVFDSTFTPGRKAMIMQLDRLVPAWMEAVPLMHVGDEWTLYVPPALGYGDEGAGPIPPGSVLVFRMQLLGFLSND
jgi:FKBP-type peptidyl-prolyl cis-trans isomerase